MQQGTQVAQQQASVPAEAHPETTNQVEIEVFARRIVLMSAGAQRREVAVVLEITPVVPAEPVHNRLDQRGIQPLVRRRMNGLQGGVGFFALFGRQIANRQQHLKVRQGETVVSQIDDAAPAASIPFGVDGLRQAQALRDGERVAAEVCRQPAQDTSSPVQRRGRCVQPPVGVETPTAAVDHTRWRKGKRPQPAEGFGRGVVQVNEQRGQCHDVSCATPPPASQLRTAQPHREVSAPPGSVGGQQMLHRLVERIRVVEQDVARGGWVLPIGMDSGQRQAGGLPVGLAAQQQRFEEVMRFVKPLRTMPAVPGGFRGMGGWCERRR